MEKQADSEPCRGISQRTVSQGSHKNESWKQVTAHTRRKVPPPSQNLTKMTCTFHNRYEALELDVQTTDEVGEGPSGIVEPSKITPTVPCITISSVKRKGKVVLIRHSLLRGTESPTCRPSTHREVCCLPEAQIRDITGEVSSLIRSSDYNLLLFVQTGSDKIMKRSLRAKKETS